MNVQIKLFAMARELAGSPQIQVQLNEGACVADLRRALIEQVPALADMAPHIVFAINADYADDNAIIPPAAEVACIPPVSGG